MTRPGERGPRSGYVATRGGAEGRGCEEALPLNKMWEGHRQRGAGSDVPAPPYWLLEVANAPPES